MRITLSTNSGLFAIVAEDGRDLLVQHDYDFPGVAATFGFVLSALPLNDGSYCPADHDGTDGTVACLSCGQPAYFFIKAASDYLSDNVGETADDPGYFTDDNKLEALYA